MTYFLLRKNLLIARKAKVEGGIEVWTAIPNGGPVSQDNAKVSELYGELISGYRRTT